MTEIKNLELYLYINCKNGHYTKILRASYTQQIKA
jgi:hypothetical protein